VKAITLTQPWATLVAIGAKRIETRSWGTNYRGPLAIHAAKGLGSVGGLEGLKDLCQTPPFNTVLLSAGIHFAHELPLGAVVATCRVAECFHIDSANPAPALAWFEAHAADNDREFGDYTLGRYMWLLDDIVALPEPSPARGLLGLWEWAAPGEVTP
jgi:hypothetical protein